MLAPLLERLLAFAVVGALFVPIERLFALHREQAVLRPGWQLDFIHFCVNHFLIQIAVLVPIVPLYLLMKPWVSPVFQDVVAAQPLGLQIAAALLVADIVSYFTHRLSHEMPWLWKFHAIHHSSPRMDWLAATRLHPVDVAITRAVQFAVLFPLGFSRATFGILPGLLGFYAIFIHSNTRFPMRWLRYLLAKPEYHHWHHSGKPETYNKNYALFPVIDWLFGTCYYTDRMPDEYGAPATLPQTYWGQLTYPFRRAPIHAAPPAPAEVSV